MTVAVVLNSKSVNPIRIARTIATVNRPDSFDTASVPLAAARILAQPEGSSKPFRNQPFFGSFGSSFSRGAGGRGGPSLRI
jgi:hypothetical protein